MVSKHSSIRGYSSISSHRTGLLLWCTPLVLLHQLQPILAQPGNSANAGNSGNAASAGNSANAGNSGNAGSSGNSSSQQPPVPWKNCNSGQQLIMCGDIPLDPTFAADRAWCCARQAPRAVPARVQSTINFAATQKAATQSVITRTDLTGSDYSSQPNFALLSPPPANLTANVPTFLVPSGWTYTNVTVVSYTVPQLTPSVIQQVKNASLYSTAVPDAIRAYYTGLRSVNTVNGTSFNHPGSGAGPGELAVMRYRVASGAAVQSAARDSLISGTGVKPKTYVTQWGTWSPPTDCQPTGYYGPLPMASVQIRYGGSDASGVVCPANYPATAPQDQCGHESFVELDGQMAYKMAIAYHITNDTRYSNKVLDIVTAWCTNNTKWGWAWENGPLEAGWGVAAMARALEMVRQLAPPGLIQKFTTWVMGPPYTNNVMYNMQYYITLVNSQNISNKYINWHSTLAEAYMAVGVLSDNITTYNQGVSIFNATVSDYLKWGKGAYAAGPPSARVLGETSETLRDMYHTQFGLGGLLQAAEIAWQQDDASLYARDNFALASAMETHARLTNAYLSSKSTTMLPQNFKYYDSNSFPAPPANCAWKFQTSTQLWQAFWTANGSYAGVDLTNGYKYLLGPGFEPTGWEMGYNHYAGRLGIPMPETAALLSSSWPEWQEFHWGLGTLSHAQSATTLWRSGLGQNSTMFSGAMAPAAATAATAAVTGTTAATSGTSTSVAGTNGTATNTTGVDTTVNGTTANTITTAIKSGSWLPGPSWTLWCLVLLVAVLDVAG